MGADIDLGARAEPGRPVIALIGRPGSGKGTQATRLTEALGIPHVSTGDALRRVAYDDTDLGRQVAGFLDVGELVPDEVVAAIVAREVPRPETGVVLDGFPRTGRQCELLAELWGWSGAGLAVELEVPVADVLRRLARRRSCPACQATISAPEPGPSRCQRCGEMTTTRPDDRPEAIQRRMWQHERSVVSVRAWFQRHDRLVTVDGCGAPDEVAARLLDSLDRGHPAGRHLDTGLLAAG